jgi:replicative DNA helicase
MNEQLPVPAGGASSDGTASDETEGVLPHNIEAEQQLLGAILSSNDVLDKVEELVKPDHFFDPVHREIFQMIWPRASPRGWPPTPRR